MILLAMHLASRHRVKTRCRCNLPTVTDGSCAAGHADHAGVLHRILKELFDQGVVGGLGHAEPRRRDVPEPNIIVEVLAPVRHSCFAKAMAIELHRWEQSGRS